VTDITGALMERICRRILLRGASQSEPLQATPSMISYRPSAAAS